MPFVALRLECVDRNTYGQGLYAFRPGRTPLGVRG